MAFSFLALDKSRPNGFSITIRDSVVAMPHFFKREAISPNKPGPTDK